MIGLHRISAVPWSLELLNEYQIQSLEPELA